MAQVRELCQDSTLNSPFSAPRTRSFKGIARVQKPWIYILVAYKYI